MIAANQRARSHDDRALSSAPRGARWRACSRGAGALRRGGAGAGRGGRGRRHEAAREREQRRRRATTSRSPRRSSPRRTRSTARRTSATARRAATSCRRSCRPQQGRRGWLRDAKRRLDEQRAEEARPIPRSRPERLREVEAPARGGARGRVPRERGLRGLPRAWGDEGRPPLRAAAEALSSRPRRRPGKVNLTDPDSRLREGDARLHPGLQRPSRHQRAARSWSPPR